MNIALLTAAGVSVRMGQDIPKQFMHVNDKPIIVHTLEAFQKHPNIDAIIVVTLNAWKDVLWAYAKQFNIDKLRWVVPGGKNGQESIKCGLMAIEKECDEDDVVMVHDGNRPMISQEIISNSLAAFTEFGSAVAVIPCVEVVFRSRDGITSVDSIPREELFRTQTPHTYTLKKLLWAHDEGEKKGIFNTAASCQLMYQLGEQSHFSIGSEENIKITTLDDINIFKALISSRKAEWMK